MKIFNLKEVVKILGLNIQTIRNLIKEGKLEASKVGTHYLVTDEAISKFLEDTKVTPKKED